MYMPQSFKIVLVFLITLNCANAADSYIITDRGMDMGARTYAVACSDGKNASVNIQFNTENSTRNEELESPGLTMQSEGSTSTMPSIIQVCIFPFEGKEECRTSWKLKEAAKASCF